MIIGRYCGNRWGLFAAARWPVWELVGRCRGGGRSSPAARGPTRAAAALCKTDGPASFGCCLEQTGPREKTSLSPIPSLLGTSACPWHEGRVVLLRSRSRCRRPAFPAPGPQRMATDRIVYPQEEYLIYLLSFQFKREKLVPSHQFPVNELFSLEGVDFPCGSELAVDNGVRRGGCQLGGWSRARPRACPSPEQTEAPQTCSGADSSGRGLGGDEPHSSPWGEGRAGFLRSSRGSPCSL